MYKIDQRSSRDQLITIYKEVQLCDKIPGSPKTFLLAKYVH